MKKMVKIKIKYIGDKGENVERDGSYEERLEEFLSEQGFKEDHVDVKNIWDIKGKLAKKLKRKPKIVRTVVQKIYLKREKDAKENGAKAQKAGKEKGTKGKK